MDEALWSVDCELFFDGNVRRTGQGNRGHVPREKACLRLDRPIAQDRQPGIGDLRYSQVANLRGGLSISDTT